MPEYVLIRLDNLERQLANLTQRVYRLEAEKSGQTVESPAEAPIVGRTPWSARVPLDPLPAGTSEPVVPPEQADEGVGRGPGGPPHNAPEVVFHEVSAPNFGMTPTSAARSGAEWEALLGGNWLNKIGAFLLVIGIALALGYSFNHMGPAGRDAVGLGAGLAMLGAGVFYERRPRYQIFARGLIGGGWATIYFTVYAMQALEAARVIHSPITGAVLLTGVAAAMIAHALRYRSEAVAGVAYFSAFVALAVTDVTSFSVIALVPLAASLLYLAHRLRWSGLALFGLVATYVTCASRGDTGAPLWSAQAIFAVYWLLFEGFDLLAPRKWLMPLNAAGFLSLSLLKWNAADAAHVWVFLAAAAAAYAVSGGLRARLHPGVAGLEGGWEGPATLTAGLAAFAIFQRLEHQWLLVALLAEGELFYLCGMRLRAAYLRALAIPLYALLALQLIAVEAVHMPARSWTPVAALTAAVFYANRALRPADKFYGYLASAVAALAAGFEAPARECGRVWFLLAAGPFVVGWWRRLVDFRFQGYALACLAAIGTIVTAPHPPLSTAIGAAVSYGLALAALWSAEDRFIARERAALFNVASWSGAALVAVLLRATLPHAALGAAWSAEALALACVALRLKRPALRWQASVAAAAAFAACWIVNFWSGDTTLAAAGAVACFYAIQLVMPRDLKERLYHALLATALLTGLLYYEISGSVLTVAWGIEGLTLLASGFPLRDRALRLSGLTLLLLCILKLFLYDLSSLETLPRIFSFIVLGLILVGVSWIYTRFRERVQKYL